MWNRFNIKIQLIVFMTVVVSVIEISTLFFVYDLQKRENRENALLEIKAITKSINNDLLKAILNPNADMFSDITYRLSAFQNINGLILYNDAKKAIYEYGDEKTIQKKEGVIFAENTLFIDDRLFIKKNIDAEGYTFGSALLEIDLSSYRQKQLHTAYTILAIFPFALLFGFILSLFLSRNYTKPFFRLLDAMKQSDPTNNKIVKIDTTAKNEIKELFKGFNTMMQQIAGSTQKLHHQAMHDQLTNIYNRFFMEETLQNALSGELGQSFNLLHIDLDQFKLINDSAGFQAGDALLKMLTAEYQNTVPQNGIFARVDGDGFMVLLENSSEEEGLGFLKESLEKLQDFRFTYHNETYSISASISLVFFKPHQYTLKELLKASNTALYSAKSQGRNKSYVYNGSDEVAKRFTTEAETAKLIKEALGGGPSRFELFAQDIVPLQHQTPKVGYEILIRMWDKDGNFVSPGDFLPAAERYNLMTDIDIYVLWTYLESVTKDRAHINNLHSAHINLAGSSLNNPDFQAKVKEAIAHFDFPWEKLELEVTESSAIGSFNMANEFIAWLKGNKIGLALDDFGTGMASFEYLKSLPFDVVKIDGSFVKDMHKDPTDKAVIKYIQEIAELKGQKTVAEYVETEEDVKTLTALKITYGQGYFLGKPRPLSSWLSN